MVGGLPAAGTGPISKADSPYSNREVRMTHMHPLRTLATVATCTAAALMGPAMSPAGAQSPAQQAGSAHAALLTVTNVAAQLGIKVSSRASEDLAVGTSITGTLVQPDTIAKLGVS